MRRWRVAFVASLLTSSLTAQATRPAASVSVRADNDAFNFWQAPWSRPDEEYTSGVRLMINEPARTWSFGQDIYTATHRRGVPDDPAARPDAGVLWASYMWRRATPDRIVERGLIVGVTGRAALAEPMQRFFHGLAPGWNKPIDWSRQLPGEPVAALTYDVRWRDRWPTLHLSPHAGASLGTLLTEVRAGTSGEWTLTRRLSLFGDAGLHLVGRNEVLSGTFFRSSDRVTLRPLVGEWQFGVRGTIKRLTLTWSAHQTGAEYTGRRGPHLWSSLTATWQR